MAVPSLHYIDVRRWSATLFAKADADNTGFAAVDIVVHDGKGYGIVYVIAHVCIENQSYRLLLWTFTCKEQKSQQGIEKRFHGHPPRQLPANTIQARPVMKNTNIKPSKRPVALSEPLNSFQIKIPQIAAIIGAPCPSAYEMAAPAFPALM